MGICGPEQNAMQHQCLAFCASRIFIDQSCSKNRKVLYLYLESVFFYHHADMLWCVSKWPFIGILISNLLKIQTSIHN